MRSLTKSPLRLASLALRVGQEGLTRYSSRFSRKDFTQPQLFALVVLKQFFRTDCRGIRSIVAEWAELQALLQLTKVPDHTTIWRAERRLMRGDAFSRLLTRIFAHARALGLIEERPTVAIDSTGLDSRHVSHYFRGRRGRQEILWKNWPKLTAVGHIATHLIAGADVCRGPSHDYRRLPPAMEQANALLHPYRVLADSGYDSESNHRFCRQQLGIPSTIIAVNPRGSHTGRPKGGYRLMMHANFPTRLYGQRWQIESLFSSHKRRLGAAVTTRSDARQHQEILLRVLTHNLMILRCPQRVATEQDEHR
jgi:hypothetical protein